MLDVGIRPVFVHVDDSAKTVATDDQISLANVVESKNVRYYSFGSQFLLYKDTLWETMLKPEPKWDAALALQLVLNQTLEQMRLEEAVNKNKAPSR